MNPIIRTEPFNHFAPAPVARRREISSLWSGYSLFHHLTNNLSISHSTSARYSGGRGQDDVLPAATDSDERWYTLYLTTSRLTVINSSLIHSSSSSSLHCAGKVDGDGEGMLAPIVSPTYCVPVCDEDDANRQPYVSV